MSAKKVAGWNSRQAATLQHPRSTIADNDSEKSDLFVTVVPEVTYGQVIGTLGVERLSAKQEGSMRSARLTFQMAEMAVSRELFTAILERTQRFGVPPPLLQRG